MKTLLLLLAAQADSEDAGYLKNMASWRDAVISYMVNGPGLFNVPDSREDAYHDAALIYVFQRDGVPVAKAESQYMLHIARCGDEGLISAFAAFIRRKRVAEMTYAVKHMTRLLKEGELKEERRKFTEEALAAVKARLAAFDENGVKKK